MPSASRVSRDAAHRTGHPAPPRLKPVGVLSRSMTAGEWLVPRSSTIAAVPPCQLVNPQTEADESLRLELPGPLKTGGLAAGRVALAVRLMGGHGGLTFWVFVPLDYQVGDDHV